MRRKVWDYLRKVWDYFPLKQPKYEEDEDGGLMILVDFICFAFYFPFLLTSFFLFSFYFIFPFPLFYIYLIIFLFVFYFSLFYLFSFISFV